MLDNEQNNQEIDTSKIKKSMQNYLNQVKKKTFVYKTHKLTQQK